MAWFSNEAGLFNYGRQSKNPRQVREDTDSFSKLTVQNSALILVRRPYLIPGSPTLTLFSASTLLTHHATDSWPKIPYLHGCFHE